MKALEAFDDFLARTAAAQPEPYADAIRAAAPTLTPDQVVTEFERMKAFILQHYEGVRPTHTYLNAGGQLVDCVPIDQQPAAREARRQGVPGGVARPAPSAVRGGAPHAAGEHQTPTRTAPGPCPEGSISLPRITLERLVQFGTLANYFRK